jgi:lipid-binding SYLF domain-containing protein
MSMNALIQEVKAAIKRIEKSDKSVLNELKKAAGFAVFPSVGRAAVVLGGAYGRGLVFEEGQPIGEASVGQFTVGVQVGGQTFSLLLIFKTKESFERFKHGRIAFNASASATIGKAAATGTADYEKDVIAKAYSLGGMLLEASLGGQAFRFKPKSILDEQAPPKPKPERKVS